jgi:glycosyltransferase involved in cell wall biosynthesis
LPVKAVTVEVAARRHDLVHVHGEVAAGICLPALALRASVVTFHGLHLLRRARGMRALAARANLRLILRTASRTICVSEAELTDVVSVVGPDAGQRATVIHNGVALQTPPSPEQRAAARAALGLTEAQVVGLWLGGLDAHKAPLVAVDAAVRAAAGEKGAGLVLLVAGDGPLRPEVEGVARHSDAIRALGFRGDAPQLMAASDFFVLSSEREGLSYALLEAMATGLPAVVSDAPGNPEAVGDAGIVLPRGDVAAFTAAFREMVRDTPSRLALGLRAHDRIASQFRLDTMMAKTRAVYEAV